MLSRILQKSFGQNIKNEFEGAALCLNERWPLVKELDSNYGRNRG